jgi:hypothetical protein
MAWPQTRPTWQQAAPLGCSNSACCAIGPDKPPGCSDPSGSLRAGSAYPIDSVQDHLPDAAAVPVNVTDRHFTPHYAEFPCDHD